MHLLTILAFAFLFWRAEDPDRWVIVGDGDIVWTLVAVLGQPLVILLGAVIIRHRGLRLIHKPGGVPDAAYQLQHRGTMILRTVALAGFAATVFLTRWPDWVDLSGISPMLQVVGDLIAITPFVVAILALWIATYPVERALRIQPLPVSDHGDDEGDRGWQFASYLDFHVRHYLLIVAIPMSFILFAANVTRGYAPAIQSWTGLIWGPDLLLGIAAACVFTVAPLMLRRIWRTQPLESGPVRERLETLCRRMGLRCRDILLWKSDGMMINAAVMGVIPAVRFVLLSDALLASMDDKQIEAVFGHEAGHIRRHHIPHFLLFAFVGWLGVAGLMEFLARSAIAMDAPLDWALLGVEGTGVVATMVFWGVGFGMLSRRFERQADLFGARCITPQPAQCRVPCSVHLDEGTTLDAGDRVCATGAAVFSSALERVAILNGIPLEERSWRHSSIGSRIRFLASVAGDPGRAERFERQIRRVKKILLATAVVGSVVCAWYLMSVSQPAVFRLEAGL